MAILEFKENMEFRNFVQYAVADKFGIPIEVREEEYVTGLLGKDEVKECFKIGFFPKFARTEWVEDKISLEIHRYCYKNKLSLNREPIIERSVWNGEIKYELVYTKGDGLQW